MGCSFITIKERKEHGTYLKVCPEKYITSCYSIEVICSFHRITVSHYSPGVECKHDFVHLLLNILVT